MTAPIIGWLDLETTGLDFEKDKITEIGFVVKRWGDKKPLKMHHAYLQREGVEITDFISDLTGITADLLDTQGVGQPEAMGYLYNMMEKCDYIIAHNGEGFDKPMLAASMESCHILLPETHWIDSQADIEWPFKSRSLTYLCAELGFLNPFPHDALCDALSMCKAVELGEGKYYDDFDALVAYSKEPWIYIKANVSYNNRDLAKELRYRWEKVGDKIFSKTWVKKIKECNFEKEKKEATFTVTKIGQ